MSENKWIEDQNLLVNICELIVLSTSSVFKLIQGLYD